MNRDTFELFRHWLRLRLHRLRSNFLKGVPHLAVLITSCCLLPQASAQGISAANREWYVLTTEPRGMVVVARDRSNPSTTFPRVFVGIHRIAKGTTPDNYDYSVEQIAVACDSRDQQSESYHLYELDGRVVSGRTSPRAWHVPTDDRSQRLKEFACNNLVLEALPAVRTHAEITTSHRLRQRFPQTSLDVASAGTHWHYVDVSAHRLVTVDVHGAWDGQTANTRRMSIAHFNARSVADTDFRVEVMEFDCAKAGRHRQVALAEYGVIGELANLTGAIVHRPDLQWTEKARVLDPLTDETWRWACEGDQQEGALPAGYSFPQILAWYRTHL